MGVAQLNELARVPEPALGQSARRGGLSFRPGNEALLSFTPIGRVVSWDLDPQMWREQACLVAGRTLSDAEARLYLGDDTTARPCDV
jgi:hypothetical protein